MWHGMVKERQASIATSIELGKRASTIDRQGSIEVDDNTATVYTRDPRISSLRLQHIVESFCRTETAT